MAPPDLFPLSYPADVRPALASEPWVSRIARASSIEAGSRILVLGAGDGVPARVLAQTLGADVVVVDPSKSALDRLWRKVEDAGVSGRVTVKEASFEALPFEVESFAAIFVDVVPPLSFERAVQSLRSLLTKQGKLVLGYPVLVSRHPAQSVLDFWEERLGEKLLTPRDYLQILEREGYASQTLETLEESVVDDFYLEVEKAADAEDDELAREEVLLHRSQQGRTGVSFSVFVGRRKEPGEVPPASRHE